jgi:hypothetical protein
MARPGREKLLRVRRIGSVRDWRARRQTLTRTVKALRLFTVPVNPRHDRCSVRGISVSEHCSPEEPGLKIEN